MTNRTEQFAAEARSADQSVRKLKQEAGELKAALSSSQAECNHLRQQMRVSSYLSIPSMPCMQLLHYMLLKNPFIADLSI